MFFYLDFENCLGFGTWDLEFYPQEIDEYFN